MKKVLLDTSFILTCVKQKIDLFDELISWGFKILIPKEVIGEIKKIEKSRKKAHVRRNASLSLEIIKRNEKFIEEIELQNSNVDEGIIERAKLEDIVVATLDKEIKSQTRKNLVIKRRKVLDVV